MQIIAAVLIICPGIISAEYYQRIRKVKDNESAFLVNCALFIFLINFADILIIYMRGWNEFSFDTMGASFMVKYMFMSFILAYVIPYIYKLVSYIIGRYITGSIKKK